MSYSNTQTTTQTPMTTNTNSQSIQQQTNMAEAQYIQQNKLPANPDIKIVECPLSQASSFSADNGNWINEFVEPIFIPKGSEIKVQSVFVESRGISGEILVFDSGNDLTSRNDNITHLYGFYVNNTGYNDMVLEYDIKARGITPTALKDSGHNYKKYQLQQYKNILERAPYFCGGNNLINRIIRTDVDSYYELSTTIPTHSFVETLYFLSPREDPFVSGRFLSPISTSPEATTNNLLKLQLNTTSCFNYGKYFSAETADMSFYKTNTDDGYIVLDFGYYNTDFNYQRYVAPQQKDSKEQYVTDTETIYALNHFQRGDVIKITYNGTFTNTSVVEEDCTFGIREINSKFGGFLIVKDRVDLQSFNFPYYAGVLTQLQNQAASNTDAAKRLDLFLQGKFIAMTTFADKTNFNTTNKLFARNFQVSDSISLFSIQDILSHTTPPTGITNMYAEIALTPFYQTDEDGHGFGFSSTQFGFNNAITQSSTYPYTRDFVYNTPVDTEFTYAQYRPQDINDVTNKVVSMTSTTLKYKSGGEKSLLTLPIVSITADATTLPVSSIITINTNETKNIASIINANDIAIINIDAGVNGKQEQVALIGGDWTFTAGSPNVYTFRVFRAINSKFVDNATKISFFINKDILTNFNANVIALKGIQLTEQQKHYAYTTSSPFYQATTDFQTFEISYTGETDFVVGMNSPSGFWGRLDTSNFYDTNMPKLLPNLTSSQYDTYQQGISNCLVDSDADLGSIVILRSGFKTFYLNALNLQPIQVQYEPTTIQPDNNFKQTTFSDTSDDLYEWIDYFSTFSYKVPKSYMSPSDLSSDYTDKTHASTGIIDYDNAKEYTDTKKSGVFQNRWLIPIFSSNLTDNTYNTTTGLMNASTTNATRFQPNSFKAIGTMDASLLVSSSLKTSDNQYEMYFRNQHSFIRNYDPLDPTRAKLPVVENANINNTDGNSKTIAVMWDGRKINQTNSTFPEAAFQDTTTNYPIRYCTTTTDTKGNTLTQNHVVSQFAGTLNPTLQFNNSLSLFEFSFFHTPYSTSFDADTNQGGTTAIVVNYPTQQFVDNIEQISGVKMGNWAKPNYVVGMFRPSEINTLTPAPYPNGLNPFTSKDPIGNRFMNKLGYSDTTISSFESIDITTDGGTTGSDVDTASAIINTKQAVEDQPNYQTNLLASSSTKPAYDNQFLGDIIFYPYGIDSDTGNMKDNNDIRYDFALPRFSSIGGLRITNHNTGMGLPSTINSFIYTDPSTIPRTFNPDYQKYSSYIIQSDSSALRADNLPIKFENGYFLLQSSLADNNSNFYIGKDGQRNPIISTILKTYISGDFIISFNSPYSIYTKEDRYVGKIENKIINSNGDVPSNLGRNSAVIYQITNYNVKDEKEQPTILDKQQQEYEILDMIEKFKGGAKTNPLQQAVADVGELADVAIHPLDYATTNDSPADMMGQLKQKLMDYDVPNMTREQREFFFTNHPVGQQLYADIQTGIHIQDYVQTLEEYESQQRAPQISARVNTRLLELVDMARERIRDRRYRTYEPTIQKPEPELTDIGEEVGGIFRPRTREQRDNLERQVGIGESRFTKPIGGTPMKITTEQKKVRFKKGIKEGEIKTRLVGKRQDVTQQLTYTNPALDRIDKRAKATRRRQQQVGFQTLGQASRIGETPSQLENKPLIASKSPSETASESGYGTYLPSESSYSVATEPVASSQPRTPPQQKPQEE